MLKAHVRKSVGSIPTDCKIFLYDVFTPAVSTRSVLGMDFSNFCLIVFQGISTHKIWQLLSSNPQTLVLTVGGDNLQEK